GKRPIAKIKHNGPKFEEIVESTVDATLSQTYAERCAAEMGNIPAFSCLEGKPLEITVEGAKATKLVKSCDRPAQLASLGRGDRRCVRGSRLVPGLSTGHKDVVTVALCRKYKEDENEKDA